MTPTRPWQDTCGVLGDYRVRGFDASSLYAYSGGPHQATHQQELVKDCYSFGRTFRTRLNTTLQLADPWVLNVRSVNGGCVNRGHVLRHDRPEASRCPREPRCTAEQRHELVDGLPSDVKVATTADLAASVGRAPGQLPGLSLEDFVGSQPH